MSAGMTATTDRGSPRQGPGISAARGVISRRPARPAGNLQSWSLRRRHGNPRRLSRLPRAHPRDADRPRKDRPIAGRRQGTAPRAPDDARDVPLAFRDEDGEVARPSSSGLPRHRGAATRQRLRELVAELHEADQGALLEALDPETRPKLIELLGDDFDFAALTEVDDAVREEILDELPTETVVEGVRDLDSDDAVYILEDLDKADQDEILDALPATERVALQRALDYPGGLGRPADADGVHRRAAVLDASARRSTTCATAPTCRTRFYEIFVVDPGHRLLGSVALDRLVRSQAPERRIERHAWTTTATACTPTDDQEEVARLFERYNLVSAAVVDEAERLVGVLTIDDIVDVIQEEADEEIKALGGVSATRNCRTRSGPSRAAASPGCSST